MTANSSPTDIYGEELSTFEVAEDGCRFRLGFKGAGGQNCTLNMPTECLHSLIMTLPQMMERSLKLRYRDESLRLVYSTNEVRVERSSDPKTIIITLITPDGFAVSFGLTEAQMKQLAGAIIHAGSPGISRAKAN